MAVKANGYGHGSVPIAMTAQTEGVEYFGIATVDEGVELRKAGITAGIILLSLPLPGEIKDLISNSISCVAADESICEQLNTAAGEMNTRAGAHLKIDTGMGRIGCSPEEAPVLAEKIAAMPNLILEGIFTHFPAADIEDHGFTRNQIRLFQNAVAEIRKKSINPGIIHAANSGAILGHPDSYFDMVRPGILLYGYYPSRYQRNHLNLKPVMELKSRVVFIKEVPRGTGISYGLTYTTDSRTTIATIPVGYGDGYSRLLSNKSEVLINGRLFPVSGTICMDQLMVDIGNNGNVELYNEAVLFGPDPAGPNAEDLADLIGTIPYEITCGINKRVPRIYVDSGTD